MPQHLLYRITCLLVLAGIVLLPAASPALAAAAIPGVPSGWSIQAVDSPRTFSAMGPHAIAAKQETDTSYSVHVAYGGQNLYYAKRSASGAWSTEIVDDGWGMTNAAIAMSHSGIHPFISYYDRPNGNLKLAYNLTGTWKIVDWLGYSNQDFGSASDIAVDSSGMIHVVFIDDTLHQLVYLTHVPGSSVAPMYTFATGITSGNFSLTLNAAGTPYISYFKDTGSNTGGLHYGHLNASYVFVEDWSYACTDCVTGEVNQAAIGSNNTLVGFTVRHPAAGTEETLLARYYASSWYVYTLHEDLAASQISIAPYLADSFTVAFQLPGGIYVAEYASASVLNVTWLVHDAKYPAVARVNASGSVWCLVYQDPDTGDYSLTTRTTGSWSAAQNFDRSKIVGRKPAIAVKNGISHIVAFDETAEALKYYRLEPSGTVTSTIQTYAPVAAAAIQLPPSGGVRVGYIDVPNLVSATGTLAPLGGMSWAKENADTVLVDGDEDQKIGMAVDSAGRGHFAYLRQGGYPTYAYYDGTTWRHTPLPNGGTADGGRSYAIVIGADDQPCFLYTDGDKLMYAKRTSKNGDTLTTFSSEVLASGISGGDVAMALGKLGLPLIAYSNVGVLKVSQMALLLPGHTWNTESLTPMLAFEGLSMQTNSAGLPVLAFNELSTGLKVYAKQANGAWSAAEVDPQVGMFVDQLAIDLNSTGKPRLAYADPTYGDLRYAYQLEQVFIPAALK